MRLFLWFSNTVNLVEMVKRTMRFKNSLRYFIICRVLLPLKEFVQVSMLSSATGSLALDENAKFWLESKQQNCCCVMSDSMTRILYFVRSSPEREHAHLNKLPWLQGKVKRVKLDTCKYSPDLEAHNASKKQHLALGTSTCKLESCKAHDFSTLTDETSHLNKHERFMHKKT